MSGKERILALRLMEKLERNPAYAKRIGVWVSMVEKEGDVRNEKAGKRPLADAMFPKCALQTERRSENAWRQD